MPPDSTHFLQTFIDPAPYTPTTIIAFLSLIVAIIAAYYASAPYRKRRREERVIEKNFGVELYSLDDVEKIKSDARYYVPPDCSSVDPAQEAEIRQVLATKQKLFETIDEYLDKPGPHRHLLVLADSGMGKSSFVLNYYIRNQLRSKKQRRRLAVVPLGVPDADEHIAKIENKRETILFLDAFDEDTKAIQDHRQRLLDLMQKCRKFNRVLLTCRTQFFPRDEEIPKETGIARVGPRKAGEGKSYEFWKLYLSPLSDAQVETFLLQRYGWRKTEREKAQELIAKIPLLSVRPMLMAYVPDLLESEAKIEYAFQLYDVLVQKWYEREAGFVEQEKLQKFTELLAVDLYAKRKQRGSERISRDELKPQAEAWNIDLKEWQLSGRSLLNRDAEGNHKFAHRSIMEFLFIKQFIAGNENCRNMAWTDQMKKFMREWIDFEIKEKGKIETDLVGASLGDRTFRTDGKTLGQDEVKKMLSEFDIFDSDWNKNGKGVPHLYCSVEIGDEKIVYDAETGLYWQQGGSSDAMIYQDAGKYIEKLNREKFAGFEDWRMPTLEEAMLLMEREKKNDALYIDPAFDKTQRWIWTADKLDASDVWVVDFVYGLCSGDRVGYDYYVRAVRSGQSLAI